MIIVIAAVASSGNNPSGSNLSSNSNTTAPAVQTTTPAPTATTSAIPDVTDPAGGVCLSANETNGYCPGDSPAPPQYTASQQSAIQRAEDYLSSGQHFSYDGLIGQLEFDQFSAADATFAVNHITVDWNQQAVGKAQDYMQSIGGFSCGSMVSQLEFDKFTPAQASYGAQSIGLGSWLNMSGSRSSLGQR